MTEDASLGKVVNLTIMDLLMLDPECPLNLHIVDSNEMGIEKLMPDILKEISTPFVIGVSSAAVRHKIAFRLGVPVEKFSFIRDGKSDLSNTLAEGSSLVLWDYLNLDQPFTEKIVYKGWAQIDLVVILRNLVTPSGEINLNMYNLIMNE